MAATLKSTDDLNTYKGGPFAPVSARKPRHRAEPSVDTLYRAAAALPRHRATRH